VCDHLVVLVESQVQLAGDVSELLAEHRRLSGPRRQGRRSLPDTEIIEESGTERQSNLLVRTAAPILDPDWTVDPVSLEDIVLAYMARRREPVPSSPRGLEVVL
jgi:ABC-2 type transport system ATP-binding protein